MFAIMTDELKRAAAEKNAVVRSESPVLPPSHQLRRLFKMLKPHKFNKQLAAADIG
jgi:hypothetical protein